MIARFGILWRKEAAQHRWSVLAMGGVLLLIGGLRWLLIRLDGRAPSDMEGASSLITLFVPVAGLVLGHRMVVREYQTKSQLFLEALPIRRWEMILAKYTFGLLALSFLSLLALLAFALAASETAPRFLLATSLRSVGFVCSCWSVFFAIGMLGRLRFAAYLTLALGLYAIHSLTRLEVTRFGPIALIEPVAFTYERTALPWRALAQSALLSLGFLGLGLGVGLVREGSLAEVLARRAASREVAALVVLVFAELAAVGWIASATKQPPFEFTSAQVVRSRNGRAAVMYAFPELEPRARESLRVLERLEDYLKSELAVGGPIDLRVSHNNLLEAGEVRDQSARDQSRMLLEVNLGEKAFEPTLLVQRALHSNFMSLSGGRAAFEPNHWLLDGVATHLALAVSGAGVQREWSRALIAVRRRELRVVDILEWEQLMQSVGETQANALGFTLVDLLTRRHGKSPTLELSRAILAKHTVDGLASWLRSRDTTFSARFTDLMGEPFAEFVLAWRAELARRALDPELAPLLARVPLDRAELRLEQGRAGLDVRYRASGPSLPRDRECVLLHGLLRPYDIYYPEQELTRRALRWPANQAQVEGKLPGQYASKQRVFAAFECEVPELGSRERLAVERLGAP